MMLTLRSNKTDAFLRAEFAKHVGKENLDDSDWNEFVKQCNRSLKWSRYASKVEKKFNKEKRKHG